MCSLFAYFEQQSGQSYKVVKFGIIAMKTNAHFDNIES